MTKPIRLKIDRGEYVLVLRKEYEQLVGLARIAQVPELPAPDRNQHFPAVEFARATLAREFMLRRLGLGLTQRDLARSARIRVETLCRIETGKHTPSTATIVKLERALVRAEGSSPTRRRA